MTKSKVRSVKQTAHPTLVEPIEEIQNGRDLTVLGVRLCVSEPQTSQQIMDACEEEIRELAYLKWEAAGCPSGDGFDFWLEAEEQVMASRTNPPSLNS